MLDLIDLDQRLPGQRKFISCWAARGGPAGTTFIVDPGPPATASHLISSLRRRGLTRLDFILLTHIHLDHAGAAAAVAAAFPEAVVVCHPRAVRHLVDPARLWEGSRQVLGAMAEAYGRPQPVPPERVAAALPDPDAADAGGRDAAGNTEAPVAALAAAAIGAVATPGHAPHHVSYLHEEVLFAGEAAGTHLAVPGGRFYLRPATPPRFYLEQAVASLDRLLALEPPPRRLAFAHYGLGEQPPPVYLRAARAQLLRWVELTAQERRRGDDGDLAARVHARLLAEDPHYACWRELDPDLWERERAFKSHTLAGILDHLDRRGG